MEFSPDLLEILACPRCKGKVHLDESAGGFQCEACQLLYPVEDGIPNFLPEEARALVPPKQEPGGA